MSNVNEFLTARITALECDAKRELELSDQLAADIQRKQDDLRLSQQRKHVLDATAENLKAAVLSLTTNGSQESYSPRVAIKPVLSNGRLSAAKAVKALVASRPDGVSIEEAVNHLIDKIETVSPQPKRLLQTTVWSLVHRKSIESFTGSDGKEWIRSSRG